MNNPYKLTNFYLRPHSILLDGLLESNEDYKTYAYSGFDSKKNFDIQVKKYKDYLQPYVDRPIYYSINEFGFRTKKNFRKLRGQKVDVALGCSMTFGLGMYEEFTWPSVLQELTGREIINLGATGHGIDISYISLNKILEFVNVENVYHFQPIYGRYYSYMMNKQKERNHITVSPYWAHEPLYKTYDKFFIMNSLVDDEYMIFNHKRGVDATRGLCAEKGINYFIIDKDLVNFHFLTANRSSDQKNSLPFPSIVANNVPVAKGDLLSRELIHPSKFAYRDIAREFFSLEGNRDLI